MSDLPSGSCRRSAERTPALEDAGRNAVGKHVPYVAASAWHRNRELWRQHRRACHLTEDSMRRNLIYGLSMSVLAVIGISVLMSAATGDTRVVEAAMKGDRDTVRTLLKQAADVNAAQGDGMTALHWAALK